MRRGTGDDTVFACNFPFKEEEETRQTHGDRHQQQRFHLDDGIFGTDDGGLRGEHEAHV